MSLKKRALDFLFLGLALIALALSGYAYFRVREPSRSQLDQKSQLVMVGVIREYDCVECIKKVLCSWDAIKAPMIQQGIETKLAFAVESPDFDKSELNFLCEPPADLEFKPIRELKNTALMPMSTPSIMLRDNERVLILEPVFLGSNIQEIGQRLERAIAEFLPQAR